MRNIEDGSGLVIKPTQFWILILCSVVVSFCMLREIVLSRGIIRESYALVDAHERSSTDAYYKNEWEKLALATYRAGQQDAAMKDLLSQEGVSVHEGLPPGASAAAASGTTNTLSSLAPKPAPPPVPHPANP